MDVAVAAFVRGALKRLVRRLEAGDLEPPDQRTLVTDYERVVTLGGAAPVRAPHLTARGHLAAGELLASLLDGATAELPADERPYLDLVRRRLAEGNLSERIRSRLETVPEAGRREEIRRVYEELADCLADNRIWDG